MRLWPGKAGGDKSTGLIREGAQTTTRITPHGFCALRIRRAVLENFPIHLSQQTGSLPGFLDGGYLPAQSVVLIDQGIALKQSNGHGKRTIHSELGRSSLR